MIGKEDITKQLEEYQSRIAEIQQSIAAEKESLGQLLYNATLRFEENQVGAMPATELADGLDMQGVISCVKSIRVAEAEINELEKEASDLNRIRFCPKCEASLEDDDLFCPVCGERIVKEGIGDDKTQCPQCGNKRKEGAVFCAQCGFRFNDMELQPELEQTIQMRYCEKCGAELEPDAVFCYRCGHKQGE